MLLTLYRPISQLLDDSKLAFALKEQYLNHYNSTSATTPIDTLPVGKVFSYIGL